MVLLQGCSMVNRYLLGFYISIVLVKKGIAAFPKIHFCCRNEKGYAYYD